MNQIENLKKIEEEYEKCMHKLWETAIDNNYYFNISDYCYVKEILNPLEQTIKQQILEIGIKYFD